MAFNFNDGDTLSTKYVKESNLIDAFIGNRLWVAGSSSTGGVGDNTITSKSSPVQTVAGGTNWKSASGGMAFSAGIKTDGTLWTWGSSSSGQLGDNTAVNKSSPVQTVSGGTNWRLLSCGGYFCMSTKTDGTLWIWGSGASGQMGNNAATNRSSPVQTVASGTNWNLVSGGRFHAAATKTDGTLWLWGSNTSWGQLGDNTAVNKSSPVQTVSGGTNWKLVSCGALHTTTIKTDGTLWSWGRNSFGELGNGADARQSSPVQTIAGGTNWRLISSGVYHVFATKTDGTLWGWGYCANGELGNNSVVYRSSPVQTVSGGTNWKLVNCGGYSTYGIKSDGSLWSWGFNAFGQLGDNTSTNKSSPIQTVSSGTNWKELGSGRYVMLAITFSDQQI